MTITPEQLRNIVKQVSAKTISTTQAAAFLDIFHADLDLAVNQALRAVIAQHIGTAQQEN